MKNSYENMLDELSRLCGIVESYYDVWGNPRQASRETKRAILRSMGYSVDDEDALRESLQRCKTKRLRRLIEPVSVFSVKEQPGKTLLFIPAEESDNSIHWSITEESFHQPIHEGECKLAQMRVYRRHDLQGRTIREMILPLPRIEEVGYYNLDVKVGGLQDRMRLIVTPERAFMPERLLKRKGWGLALALYGIRSERNQGIGDLSDLGNLTEWVGRELGGDFVAINPLHALPNRMPFGISPYAPISRLYFNFIYIDLETVEDVRESLNARAIIHSEEYKDAVRRQRESALVDYEEVAGLKRMVLETAFEHFYQNHYLKQSERAERFNAYRRREGKRLRDYATYMALFDEFGHGWDGWPEPYRRPDSEEVIIFRKRDERRILFHEYLQWIIESELDRIRACCRDSEMAIGLSMDLPVGSPTGGYDVWANQEIFATDVDVGAPPDAFSPGGQNWGFPPLLPEALRENRYDFFVHLIRKNLCHAGALRIDHALGIFRLFWIPKGMSPQEGAYVLYPYKELLGIISLESVRNEAVIIAEDLGTVTEEIRSTLRSHGMLSFRLLYFEKDYSTGEFLPAECYPEEAIVSTTTHDLPTLSGFWAGRDIEVKKGLDRYPDEETLNRDITERGYDRWRLFRVLQRSGILPPDFPEDPSLVPEMTSELCICIYRFLALTPCRLMAVNLDDILMVPDQQNLPGTIDEYPNWRRKTPLTFEEFRLLKEFSLLKGIRSAKRVNDI